MKKTQAVYLLFFIALCCALPSCIAQSLITSKIIDQDTQQPIPYATITLGEQHGVISNEEGVFSITAKKKDNDSLRISSMGYENIAFAFKDVDSIIALQPKSYELSTVFLNDKNLPPDEIIDQVKKNMEKNHLHSYSKKRFFSRASFTQHFRKNDFGFQKSSIDAIDKKLIDSIAQSLPKKASYFFETLCDIYSNHTPEFKLDVVRALMLEDKNQATTFTGFQEKFEQLIRENVKSDSYLKIKSGLVGTKVPLDSILQDQKAKAERQKKFEELEFFNYRKRSIHHVVDHLFFNKKSDIDVLLKSSKYEFVLEEYQEIGEDLAYVLTFSPKSSADFKGKLYINTDDFAVLRLDYQNVKSVYDKKFNMFGIHFNHISYRGTMLFDKKTDEYYHLKYANQEMGESFSVKRPLKIIEKNKFVRGRRKQNEVKLALDVKMYNTIKRELVLYDITPSTNLEFENFEENKNIKIHKASSYDPNFWKGYTVLEPNQMIREYKALGTTPEKE